MTGRCENQPKDFLSFSSFFGSVFWSESLIRFSMENAGDVVSRTVKPTAARRRTEPRLAPAGT
jgi:hypothetical protein